MLLPVPLEVSSNFKSPLALGAGASSMDIRLKATWLVCRKECIPEEAEFTLALPLQGSTALHKADFDAAQAAQPQPLAKPGAVEVDGNKLQVRLEGLPAAAQGKTLGFFPETPELIRTAAESGKDWTQSWQGGTWTATLPLADQRSASPTTLPLVVALAEPDRQAGQPVAWRTEAPVSGNWPAAAAPRAEVSPALQAALAANAANAAMAPAASTDLPHHPADT